MIKGEPRPDREAKAARSLEMVKLGGYGDRRPSQLSGGQRQRIALARALVNKPRILLLDEPLGALDLKLRQQMQTELKDIQRKVGITFMFVTHDQEEALTLSDRIAVFNQGKIEQIGTPQHLYEKPQTAFVANFVGTSNVVTGVSAARMTGREGTFVLRPEKIWMDKHNEAPLDGCDTAEGVIEEAVYLGIFMRYAVRTDRGDLLLVVDQNRNHVARTVGTSVRLSWAKDAASWL